MSRKTKGFEVYICSLDKEILYIGSGKINRHKHCNSGISHVYELNKLHFEGKTFTIELKFFDTKEESLEEEINLISKYVPKFNILFTGKSSGRVDWLRNGDKLRKAFKYYNKFPENSSMFNKMNNLLNLFLEIHQLPMIESEGVLLRGRSFYKVRGHHKISNLLKNHRCTAKGVTDVFYSFLQFIEIIFRRNL